MPVPKDTRTHRHEFGYRGEKELERVFRLLFDFLGYDLTLTSEGERNVYRNIPFEELGKIDAKVSRSSEKGQS